MSLSACSGAKKPTQTITSLSVIDDKHVPAVRERQAKALAFKIITNQSDPLFKCHDLLSSLKGHSKSSPFLLPVDPIALNIPEYYHVIKEPMDLKTVSDKLNEGAYNDFNEFNSDILKIFNNAMVFNPPEHFVHKYAAELRNYYLKITTTKNFDAPKKDPAKKQKQSSKAAPNEKPSVRSTGEATALTYNEK